MIRHFLSILCLLLPAVQASSQTLLLSGTVKDASTDEPLVAANVRLLGTSRGTITNAQGAFRLSLEAGRHTVVFSYIGYSPDTVMIELSRSSEYHARLVPAPILLPEIVVTDEDPAVKIMRKVIENKHRWMENLKSYRFEAFTRQVLRRDTAIASITESYSTGYWRTDDTLREVVRQKRQTENIAGSGMVASVGGIANFYLDDIDFAGFRFVGPTSREAFEYYRFRLESVQDRDGVPVYSIELQPKSRLVPLFKGKIKIIGDIYALVGVEVAPNEAFTLPFVSDLSLTYAQQFTLYNETFWMPVDIRIRGWAELGIVGISMPRIGFEQTSSIYDYEINPELADSVFRKPRRVVLPEAASLDSAFWARHEVLPLTEEEHRAYATLDSAQSLRKQFDPGGPLSVLSGSRLPALLAPLKHLDLRYNRVEGGLVGLKFFVDSVLTRLRVYGSAGYGTADKRTSFRLGAVVFLDDRRRNSIDLEAFRRLDNVPDGDVYNAFAISLGSLLARNDYRDYYYSRGWQFHLNASPARRLFFRAQFSHEEQSAAVERTSFSLLSRGREFRSNPSIDEGTMGAVSFSVRYGESSAPLGLIGVDFVEFSAEHSARSLLGSDFDYSRALVRGELHVRTFLKRVIFPPMLSLHAEAGASRGKLPLQRLFSIDSRYCGYAPLGVLRGAGVKEFQGDRYVLISVEHNFRNTPFLLLNVPFLYRSGMELVPHASVARSWISPASTHPSGTTTRGWYVEAGVGLNKLFGLLRLDVTYRISEPRGAYLSFSAARIL